MKRFSLEGSAWMNQENEARIRTKVQETFDSGWNCCETVVKVVCEELGVDSTVPVKIASPLGSGMSKNGATCGALNGAFIVFGYLFGREANADNREPSYNPSDRVFNKFKEKYGSYTCRELTGLDLRDPEVMALNKPRLHGEICGPMVQETVLMVLEEIKAE